MKLFNLEEFDFPELIKEPVSFQEKVRKFFDSGPEHCVVIRGKGEFINNSYIDGEVYLREGAVIKPFSYIEGRVFVGENSIIGPQAKIKGDVVIGKDCRIGRCEVDNSIIMNGVKAYHHSYIGHSIVGNHVNIAAGFITANLRFNEQGVRVRGFGNSGKRKFGALIGDNVKTMVNSFLMPGSVIPPGSIVEAVRA